MLSTEVTLFFILLYFIYYLLSFFFYLLCFLSLNFRNELCWLYEFSLILA
jgi:hypothetical protein